MVEARSKAKAARRARSRATAGAVAARDHFVQFYESDGFLLNSLSDFVGEGLGAGEGCVVLAGRARREGLEDRLRASGVDVDGAGARGQYLSLDAGETLARFMVDGAPEPARFAEVVGGVLARAGRGGRRVRVFGDMVAQLCAESRHPAAVRLERLWNELLGTHPCSLFCAYPVGIFGAAELAGAFGEVCAEHARVEPAESYAGVVDAAERLRAVALLQQKANALEAEVAERRRAEEALRAVRDELEVQLRREQAARAEAEAANRLKDEFLATLSHELRTPLTAVLGWTQVLRAGQLDAAGAARALDTVERNARAQSQLVEELLDMSRIITGKLRIDARPVEPSAFVGAAVEAMRPAAEAKGVRLAVDTGEGVGAVSGDADRLRQVVWNLLSNAIKFTGAGGRVELCLKAAGPHVEIAVSDTGEGIAPEFLPHVFDRFRQADGTTTRQHGGLGLGLAIVRHLVELHGGTVTADSPGAGRGSTFTVRLPGLRNAGSGLRREAARHVAAGRQPAALNPQPTILSGLRVLVVDDEAEACDLLGVMLGQRGAEVTTATTAADALAELERARPHLLISDIGMPGVDGYELMRRVRGLPPERGGRVPAVALTAYARAEDRLRALRAGYQTHVAKPVEPDELIAVVASLSARG